jgi:transcriptional regulator with XRE-family HTH domain
MPPLSDMCKIARAEMRLTQRKFAEIIGTNQTEVSFIERGFIPHDQEKIKAIQELYQKVV